MNIHEHQAKEILKEFGIPILGGVVIFDTKEIKNKVKKLKSANLMVKAQIHAGGRGKVGGIKMAKNFEELKRETETMLGKILITHQTGKSGRKIKRLYIEETCDIKKEFYLSCLVDRMSSLVMFYFFKSFFYKFLLILSLIILKIDLAIISLPMWLV